MIKRLRPEDRFNVVVFRDTPSFLEPNRVPATEANKAAAVAFLRGLESKGQTDVYNALRPVVEQKPRAGIPGLIVLLSDGRPTTGMQDSREVINAVTAQNDLRNSVFAFGAGSTVNRYLLDLIAYRNIGRSYIVANMEETGAKLPAFFDEFSDPLLTDIKADYGRIAHDEIFPRSVPNFYRKGAVKVYGRFDPEKDKEFVMRMTGRAGSKEKELVFRAKLGEAKEATGSIASEWAFAKAYYIIGEISRQGETPALIGQLKDLSAKYNIRTSYSE
jgi:Ca-activated chloride channel family protein